MSTWLRRLLAALIGLFGLLLAAALVVPAFVDRGPLRQQLEAELGRAIGGVATIDSVAAVRLLPRPHIDLRGIQVEAPAAGQRSGRGLVARIAQLRLTAEVWPLLRGAVSLREVAIEQPRILLPAATVTGASPLRSHADQPEPAVSSSISANATTDVLPGDPFPLPSVRAGSTLGGEAAAAAASDLTSQPQVGSVQPSIPGQRQARPPAPLVLPPMSRLLIRDAELVQPDAQGSPRWRLSQLELEAAPVAVGQSGRLSGGAVLELAQVGRGVPVLLEADLGFSGDSSHPAAGLIHSILLTSTRLTFDAPPRLPDERIEVFADLRIGLAAQQLLVEALRIRAGSLLATGDAVLSWSAGETVLTGDIRVTPFDLRGWSHDWLAQPVDQLLDGTAMRLRRVGAELRYRIQGARLALDDIKMNLDDSRIAGWARLQWIAVAGGAGELPPWPSGEMAFALDEIELDPYLPGMPSRVHRDTTGVPEAQPAQTAGGEPWSRDEAAETLFSLKGLLPAPPTSLTRSPDLHLRLRAGQVRIAGLDLVDVHSTAQLGATAIQANVAGTLYGGAVTAQLRAPLPILSHRRAMTVEAADPAGAAGAGAEAGGDTPATTDEAAMQADARGVDLGALLLALDPASGAQPALTGQADAQAQLRAPALDLVSLRSGLGGELNIALRDGTLGLPDLAQRLRSAFSAVGASPQDIERLTSYRTLRLSAEGHEGVFRSEDIQLRAELIHIDGNGQVSLPLQALSLSLEAVLVKPSQGRGIKELEGIPFPIRARGAWSQPLWELDLGDALRAAAQRELQRDNGLLDQLEERTGIQGLGDSVRQLLPGLLGR